MEEDKILLLDIPFEKQKFIHDSEIIMELNAKLLKKEHIKTLGFSLFFLLMGIFVNGTQTYKIVLFGISAFLFLLFVGIFLKIEFVNKKYQKSIDSLCKQYESVDFRYNFEIDKEELYYSDNYRNARYKWSDFEEIYLYKNHLILLDHKLNKQYFLFENSDSFSDNFHKILNFIQSKEKIKKVK